MLTEYEFNNLCKKLGITEKGKKIIQRIRYSPPVRLVKSRKNNVSGRYPSKEMRVTIQFESHKVELPGIYQMEYDSNVLEYYDQPNTIKLNYRHKDGRNLGIMHTPDFFVIRKDEATWEEWKTEEHLIQLSQKEPNRYFRDLDGIWRCQPGEKFAKQFGLQYRLRSSDEIDWKFHRNILFLEDYILDVNREVYPEAKESIITYIKTQRGMLLSDLLRDVNGFSSDDIYLMISRNEIYFDMNKAILTEPETVKAFLSKEHSEAYKNLITCKAEDKYNYNILKVEIGNDILWNEEPWKIINVSQEIISLLSVDKKAIELPINIFNSYTREGIIKGTPVKLNESISLEAQDILLGASKKDFAVANYRLEFVKKKLNNEEIKNLEVTDRTLRNWVKGYKISEQLYNNGYIGLIPKDKNKGNYNRKLPVETLEYLEKFIDKEYENFKQKNRFVVYGQLKNECDERGVIAPSFKTFCNEINKRDKLKLVRKRKGNRAAYKHEEFYLELSMTTPKHGDRPFEICHIDHTELDIELVCSSTGKKLGKPWLTLMTDAFSRRIVAFFLTYDSPSYKSCMMVLRECVRLHNRLPQTIVVDGGKEFSSVYFETLLARYQITKKTRPPAKSRFGSVIERQFGTTNTRFVHNLIGNTKIMKNVRQVTKSVNPKNHATWNLINFYERLNEWCYEVYDFIEHPALSLTPREAFQLGIQKSGYRPFRIVQYDESFKIMTLPAPIRESVIVQPGKGVRINYIDYWNEIMKDPRVEKSKVQVRYDPYNLGIAYAYINKKWVKCISEYFAVFNNMTEKQLKIVTSELKKRKKETNKQMIITAKIIANFITEVEKEEEILLNQKRKDKELKSILKIVDNEFNEEKENDDIDDNRNNNLHEEDLYIEDLGMFGEY